MSLSETKLVSGDETVGGDQWGRYDLRVVFENFGYDREETDWAVGC
jgi:hypothetical protein